MREGRKLGSGYGRASLGLVNAREGNEGYTILHQCAAYNRHPNVDAIASSFLYTASF